MLFEVDTCLVVYVSLAVLFLWRLVFSWHLCGKWLQFANYCVLLYALMTGSLVYDCLVFLRVTLRPEGAAVWKEMAWWIKPFVITAFASMWVTLLMCALQTAKHIDAIRRGEASLRHDRVVQILALPVVYGAMAVSSATRMFTLAAANKSAMSLESIDIASTQLIGSTYENGAPDVNVLMQLVLAKSETAYMVADLYEAWVLYQFLSLTLDVMHTSIKRKSDSKDLETRAGALAVLNVHSAIDNLSWLGPYMFLLICIGQAGWSIYVLNFAYAKSSWSSWMASMAQFQAAGFLASMAAIWDVAVVETSFHEYLDGYMPVLKFITVKILVSFSFFQRGAFDCLRAVASTMPNVIEGLVQKLPIVGDLVQMGIIEFEVFYAALIMLECTFVSLLHLCAWGAAEEWFNEEVDYDENAPLSGPASQAKLMSPGSLPR